MASTSSSVYSEGPTTTQTPMSPLNPSPTSDPTPTADPASNEDNLYAPTTSSSLNQAAPSTFHLAPAQAAEIISKSLDLNAALTDLSHHLSHVRWAIEPLRDAISLAVDPLGIHIDARENETQEERRNRLDVEDGKRMGLAVHEVPKAPARQEEETLVGKFHVATTPDVGSEMSGDFTGAWEADERWGGSGSDHVQSR